MNTYFVDSINGLDTNDGLTVDTAWKSQLHWPTLPAGSFIHISTASIIKGTLPTSLPADLTIGGGGGAIFDAGGMATILSGAYKNLHIRGMRFQGSRVRHVDGKAGSKDITFTDCTFAANGSASAVNCQAVYWTRCDGIAFYGCTFESGGWGDNLYLDRPTGIIDIIGNHFGTPYGAQADNVQIVGDPTAWSAAEILIDDNQMTMRDGPTNSGKGNVCINRMKGSIAITDNTMVGLNYCLSLACNDVMVTKNTLSNARLNSYSWGIGVGETYDVRTHSYHANIIDDCARGVTFSAPPNTNPARIDMMVSGNAINHCDVALRVDRPTSGYFTGNTLLGNSTDVIVTTKVIPSGGAYTTFETTPNP